MSSGKVVDALHKASEMEPSTELANPDEQEGFMYYDDQYMTNYPPSDFLTYLSQLVTAVRWFVTPETFSMVKRDMDNVITTSTQQQLQQMQHQLHQQQLLQRQQQQWEHQWDQMRAWQQQQQQQQQVLQVQQVPQQPVWQHPMQQAQSWTNSVKVSPVGTAAPLQQPVVQQQHVQQQTPIVAAVNLMSTQTAPSQTTAVAPVVTPAIAAPQASAVPMSSPVSLNQNSSPQDLDIAALPPGLVAPVAAPVPQTAVATAPAPQTNKPSVGFYKKKDPWEKETSCPSFCLKQHGNTVPCMLWKSKMCQFKDTCNPKTCSYAHFENELRQVCKNCTYRHVLDKDGRNCPKNYGGHLCDRCGDTHFTSQCTLCRYCGDEHVSSYCPLQSCPICGKKSRLWTNKHTGETGLHRSKWDHTLLSCPKRRCMHCGKQGHSYREEAKCSGYVQKSEVKNYESLSARDQHLVKTSLFIVPICASCKGVHLSFNCPASPKKCVVCSQNHLIWKCPVVWKWLYRSDAKALV